MIFAPWADEQSTLDVEIPGTKLSLKTAIEIARSLLGIYPRHISGDIVFPVAASANDESLAIRDQVIVTVYIMRAQNPSPAIKIVIAGDDVDKLVQRIAEAILLQVNPYVLAAYQYDNHEYQKAREIIQRIIQDPSRG